MKTTLVSEPARDARGSNAHARCFHRHLLHKSVCHCHTFADLTQLVVDGRTVRAGSSEVGTHLGLAVHVLLVLRGAILTAEQ